MLNMVLGFAVTAVRVALVGGASTIISIFPSWEVQAEVTYMAPDRLAQGEELTEILTYTIEDNHGGQAVGRIVMSVTGVNDPPIAAPMFLSVDEDDPVEEASFLGSDIDSDNDQLSLLYTVDDSTVDALAHPNVLINLGTGMYRLNPSAPELQYLADGEVLNLTFVYSVTDRHGATDIGTVNVTIVGKNDVPIAVDDVASGVEDIPVIVDPLANDDDPDSDDDSSTLKVIDVKAPSGAEVSW